MSHLSYENRVAILLGVCVIGAVVLLVAFFFVHKNAISNAQLSIPAPNIDLNETRNALNEFKAQNTQTQEPAAEQIVAPEQEQNTPLQNITQE